MTPSCFRVLGKLVRVIVGEVTVLAERRTWFDDTTSCGGLAPNEPWSIDRAVVLYNTNPVPQRVDGFRTSGVDHGSISASVYQPAGTTLPATLQPGESLALQVTWSGQGPLPGPEDEAQLIFDVTDIGNGVPYDVSMAQRLTFFEVCTTQGLLAPDLLSFGVSEMNVAESASVTLRAYGTGPLVITDIRPCAGSGPSDFTYDGPALSPTLTLPQGSEATLDFSLLPSSVGVQTGCFELLSNDPRGPHELSMVSVTANRELTVLPDTLEFADVVDLRAEQLVNSGALPLRFRSSGFTVTGPFSLFDPAGAPLTLPIDIVAGEVATIVVGLLNPNETQPADGTLSIASDLSDDAPTVSGSVTMRFRP